MKTNKEIRLTARQILHGKFSAFITLFLSGYILENLIVSIPSLFLADPHNLPLFLSRILLTVLLEALGSMFMLGVSRGALQITRGADFGLTDLLYPFKNECDHFLALELILTAVNTFTSIPGFVFVWISGDMNLLTYSLISSLFTGLSAVLTFLLTLVFSMSEFLMLDDPDLTALEALKGSMDILRGHVGQYFLLILSFLGFILLGFTSAMLGFIWVFPYILVSQAVFYNSLCSRMDEDAEEPA